MDERKLRGEAGGGLRRGFGAATSRAHVIPVAALGVLAAGLALVTLPGGKSIPRPAVQAAGNGATPAALRAAPRPGAAAAQPVAVLAPRLRDALTARLSDRSQDLTRALGPAVRAKTVERTTRAGVRVRLGGPGYKLQKGKAKLSLYSTGLGRTGGWRVYASGLARATPYGRETITIDGEKTELFQTVERSQGGRLWTWHVDTNLRPRLRVEDGAVIWQGKHPLITLPVRIYGPKGTDVTPEGARWGLAREGRGWSLRLALDDASLPTPYVIDPATITYRTAQGSTSASGTTLTLTVPSGTKATDLLIAQVVVNVASGTITAGSGWTQIGSTITGGAGPAVTMAIFRRVALGSEPASYAFTVSSGAAAGGITAFSGVDNVNPTDSAGIVVASANTGSDTAPIAPTTGTLATINEQLVTFIGAGHVTTVTPPGTQTEKYNASVSGVTASAQVDTSALGSTSSGTRTSTLGTTGQWITATVALRPAPAFRAQAQSSGTGLTTGATLAPATPTGTATGDLVIASIVFSNGSNVTITPTETGWHLIRRNDNGTTIGQATYWRLRTGAGGTFTFTFAFSSGGPIDAAIGLVSYPGVDFSTGDPVDISAVGTGTATTSLVAPTVTTNSKNGLLLTFYGADNNGTAGTTDNITPPGGMTERLARASATNGVDLESAELVLGAAGASGTKTATSGQTANNYVATTIALRGDSVPDPYMEAVLADGPSHYWRLGETTGTNQTFTSENVKVQDIVGADSMDMNTNSTGAVTSGATGLIDSDNKAMTFSEGTTNKSKAGFQSGAAITNPRTIEAWIKTNVKGYTPNFQQAVLSTRPSSASTNATTHFGLAGGHVKMFDNVGKSPTQIDGVQNNLNNGQLHYIAYVFDSTASTGTFYVDGHLDKQVTQAFAAGPKVDDSTNATIGFDLQSIGSDGSFQGTIDEVATYDYALTSAQIANHFLKGVGGGLVATEVSGQGANEYVPLLDAGPSVTATSASTTGTLAAGSYFYIVTATLANGDSGRSNEIAFTGSNPVTGIGGPALTGTTSKVTLNWTAVTGATAYKVYRSSATGTETLLATLGNVLTYVDDGTVTPGTTTPNPDLQRSAATGPIIFYKPGATGTNGYTITASPLDSQSALGNVTFPAQANATGGGAEVAPSGSPATAAVTYTWNSSYAITTAQSVTMTSGGYQSLPFFTPIQDACIPGRNGTGPTMGSTSQATTGGLLQNLTTYSYVVTATNSTSECETAPGTEVSQATLDPAQSGQNTVTINWTAVSGATGYKIYRSTTTGAETLIAIVSSGTTSYTDTNTFGAPQGFGSAQPPANPSITETSAPTLGYYTTASIAFTTSDGIDGGGFAGGGGSGLDQTTRLTERAPATSLANGLCTFPASPTFGSFTSNTIPNPTDTTSLASNCYRYRLSIKDNVNNQATVTKDVKVNTSSPTNTISVTSSNAFVSGTTLYYKSSTAGSFTLKNAVSSPIAGVGSATFPANSATGWSNHASADTVTAPVISSSSTSTSGGTLAAGSYYYVMTALGAWGETMQSQEVLLTTTGTTSSNTLNWSAVSGATGYKIYRGTSVGGETLLATLGAVTTSTDTGSSTTSTTPSTTFGSSTTYNWSASPSTPSSAQRTVRGTDAAGNFTDTVLTFTTDNTAPTGEITAPAASATVSGAVTVSSNSADSGSGVGSVQFQVATSGGTFANLGSAVTGSGPYNVTWTTTGGSYPNGTYNLRVITTDNVGNSFTSSTVTVTVNNTLPGAPTITSGPTSGTTLTSGTFTFTGLPGSIFQCSLDGGAYTTCTSPITYPGPLAVGSHTFKVRQTDTNGNTGPDATYNWTINAPSASLTLLSAVVGTDGTPITLTYDANLDTGSVPDPSAYTLLVDGVAVTPSVSVVGATVLLSVSPAILSGQVVTLSYAVPSTKKVQSTASIPAAAFTNLAVTNNSTKTLTQAPIIDEKPDQPSTKNSGTFKFHSDEPGVTGYECSLDDAAYTSCTSPLSFSGLSIGTHTFCVRSTYAGGHGPATCYTWEITAAIDDGPPYLVSTSPVDGSNITEVGPTWKLVVSEPVTWSNFLYDGPDGAPTPFFNPGGDTAEAPFNSTVPGRYTIQATASDGVNPPVIIEAHFTIPLIGDDHPPSSISVYRNESGTLQTSDFTATVRWPQGTFPGDGVVVTVDPLPVGSVSTGFKITSYAVDAEAYYLVSKVRIESLNEVLDIEFANTPADALAAVSQNDPNAWAPLPPLTSHDLPADLLEGYYRDPQGSIHVLTRHLTYYAILSDTEAPKWPGPPGAPILFGKVTGGRLNVNWRPASDNSGSIHGYRLYVNGVSVRSFDGKTLASALGPFSPKDTRLFQVSADDSAGHTSPLSNALRGIPNLVGLTLDQAKKLLLARGFKLGKLTGQDIADRGGVVVKQFPPAPGIASLGSPIDAQFGVSRAPWRLKVTGAKKLNVTKRRFVALRVVSTLKANVAITLRKTKLAPKHYRWTFKVRSGPMMVKLPIAPEVRRQPGKFTIYVASYRRGYKRILRRTTISFVKPGRPRAAAKPKDVVVVSGSKAHRDNALGLKSSSMVRQVTSTNPDAAFDLIASRDGEVEAVAVDLDSTGLSFVRDLHVLFPDLPIVAVASSRKIVGKAKLAGASRVLSWPLRPSALASAVQQLLAVRVTAERHAAVFARPRSALY